MCDSHIPEPAERSIKPNVGIASVNNRKVARAFRRLGPDHRTRLPEQIGPSFIRKCPSRTWDLAIVIHGGEDLDRLLHTAASNDVFVNGVPAF